MKKLTLSKEEQIKFLEDMRQMEKRVMMKIERRMEELKDETEPR